MKRTIYIGADSAGYTLKEEVKAHLGELGYETVDCGCDSTASCHYPEFASKVSKSVQNNLDGAFGILICGTGIGISLAANKVRGIRAAVCSEPYSAAMTRRHNDANIIAFGARVVGPATAEMIVDAFLEAEYEGGRHQRRVDMIAAIEKGESICTE